MAKGGPKKNSELDRLHGNPGKRKEKGEPEVVVGGGSYQYSVPSYLRGDQKKYVNAVSDELYRTGKSKLEYQAIFDGFCQHLYLRDKAFDELRLADQLIIKGERGIDKKHPAIQTHKDFSASTLKHAEHLGISGLTADRVKGSPKKKESKLSQWKKR